MLPRVGPIGETTASDRPEKANVAAAPAFEAVFRCPVDADELLTELQLGLYVALLVPL
jgi:hypothetical protein